MSDVLITRDGPYDAPYSYELGAREAFEPTTVEGLVDGAGAGGSFKIVCVIRSPDGKVLARVPTSETFSPGDEVAVTFAPFLRSQAVASAGVSEHWCRVVCGPTQPAGALGSGTAASVMPIISFATNTPADYVQVDANTWSIPDVPQTLCGYVVVDGGGLTVLNGDVDVLVHKTGGFATGTYGQNTLKFLIQWYAYTLTRSIETGGNWQALATGADTHNFDIIATYSAVY